MELIEGATRPQVPFGVVVFDAWIATYRQVGDIDAERIVAEVLGELN